MEKRITSLQNPEVKRVVALTEKARDRKEQSRFVVEGVREISLAQQSGYTFEKLFVCPELYKPDTEYPINLKKVEVVEVSVEVYNKMAYRANDGGALALAEQKALHLSDLSLKKAPLILVLESLEKPGNLGAILRTCDAAKVDAVLICDGKTDIYNPNAIRSGVGCLFTNQIAVCSSEDAIAWLKENKFSIFTTDLTATHYYHQVDYRQASAIVMGSEAWGVSEKWKKAASAKIKIPMGGKIDSMNVSNSAAILIYEAMRQRDFN